MKNKKEKNKTKRNKLDEKRILKQIEASFCDAGVFDLIDSYIIPKKQKAVKQA